jgi:hypothetical protein
MTSITGVEFEEAERTMTKVSIEGLELPILGRQQLLANKRATRRPKDLLDAQLLEDASED